MERFILINNERNRIKVFEPFEDVSKPSPSIDAMMISSVSYTHLTLPTTPYV